MKFAELSSSYIHLISLRDLNAPTQKRRQPLRHTPDNVEVKKLIYSLHDKNLDGVTQSWSTNTISTANEGLS